MLLYHITCKDKDKRSKEEETMFAFSLFCDEIGKKIEVM